VALWDAKAAESRMQSHSADLLAGVADPTDVQGGAQRPSRTASTRRRWHCAPRAPTWTSPLVTSMSSRNALRAGRLPWATGRARPAAVASASAAATPTMTPTSPQPTTPTVDAATAAANDSYLRYSVALTKALRRRDDRVPNLLRFSTPKRQAVDRLQIRRMRTRNIVFQGTPRDWTKSVAADARRATIRVCERQDTSRYIYASSGRRVFPLRHVWSPYVVQMVQRDDRWRVDTATHAKFSCKGAK
jgi:hypothetical protein